MVLWIFLFSVYCLECQVANGISSYIITVEPPNKGHFGNGSFVLCSEVVPISEVPLLNNVLILIYG